MTTPTVDQGCAAMGPKKEYAIRLRWENRHSKGEKEEHEIGHLRGKWPYRA
jgi:hypothetical protein